ncbi:helix-turn-helix domain-containing protein [Streptomyces sp. NPDC060048]|uniref:helix-turn-helix domain-containing protein n=1 Tax=unclassified Streptomyces TaxID=2593676 RepID=UPI00368B49BE
MSVEHMAMVINAAGLDGPEKLLLLAYCNRTDAHGYCWPGQSRLVDDTGTSAATVKRVKGRLIRKNLIKSVRRINPTTGESITNMTRVNLPLLNSMKRPPKDYDDNTIQQLTFEPEAPARAKRVRTVSQPADLRPAQDEPAPSHGAAMARDLPTAQDEPSPGLTMRPHPAQDEPAGVHNLSPRAGQPEPLTVREPPGNQQKPFPPSEDPGSDGTGPEHVGPEHAGTEHAGTEHAGADHAGTDPWRPSHGEDPEAVPNTAGVRLLTAVGAHDPSLALHGTVLRDQARRLDVLLDEGWLPEQLAPGLSRPLPRPVLTSVGAVMAARITTFAQSPCPVRLGGELPRAARGSWNGTEYARQEPTPVPPAYVQGTYATGPLRECEECGRPVLMEGELCPPCAGYVRCGTCGTWVRPGTACRKCAEDPS